MVEKAIKLAHEKHYGQKRRSGEDYITHPIAVMNILRKYDLPDEVLMAGVLHDICENTDITNMQISHEFGPRVGFILHALSKNPKPKNNEELREKYEKEKEKNGKLKTFREYVDYRFLMYVNRFYVSAIAEPWILFVKIADQIHNLSTLAPLEVRKRRRKIDEVEKLFIPIYKKAEEIITPMYDERYKKILRELRRVMRKAKKEFY